MRDLPGTFLLLCIPISMLMIAIIAAALFPKYLR